MKNTLLIHHRWKTLGWALALPAFVAGIYFLCMENQDQIPLTLPDWLKQFLWLDDHYRNQTGPIVIYLFDELIAIGLLTGLLLLAFAKEKVEDEWIRQVRLESLQWAILLNTLLLIGLILFTHGFTFLNVMVYNIFTPLLIFVGRYYWILKIKPMFSKN